MADWCGMPPAPTASRGAAWMSRGLRKSLAFEPRPPSRRASGKPLPGMRPPLYDPLREACGMTTPVLFVHGITEIGGAEPASLRVLALLPRFGYRPVVVCGERAALIEELTRRRLVTGFAHMAPCHQPFS